MLPEDLKQNVTVYGPHFPEPVQIILAIPMGSSIKVIGKGGIQSCSNGFLATTGEARMVPLSHIGLRAASRDSLSQGHLRVPALPPAWICQPEDSTLGTCFGAGPGNPRAHGWNRKYV